MTVYITFMLCALLLAGPATPSVAADENPSRPDLVSIEDFSKPPSFHSVSLSPDGERIMYRRDIGGGRSLVIADVDDQDIKETHNHAVSADIYEIGAFWLSNDRILIFEARFVGALPKREEEPAIIVYSMRDDGSEKTELWRQDPPPEPRRTRKGKKRKPVEKTSFMLLHRLPDDPDHVLVSRNEQTPVKRSDIDVDVVSDVFRLNIVSGEMTNVTPEHGVEGARMFSWLTDNAGTIRLGYGETEDEEPVLLVRASVDDPWERLDDNELFERGKFAPLMFGKDPDELYVSSSIASGRAAIYRFNLKRGRLAGKVFAHKEISAGALLYSFEKGKVLGVTYYDDEFRREIFDDDLKAELAAIEKAIGTSNFRRSASSRSRSKRVVWAGDEKSTGTAWLFDRETGAAVKLGDARPWIDPATMHAMTSVSYMARDGVDIPGYVTKPATPRPDGGYPAIVMPHGGPYVRDYKAWDTWTQFLANRGYVVLQPNYRGSTGYGYRFSALGYGEWGQDMQQDIADGAKWLVSEGLADPERICIVGGSYGGYAALMGAIQDSDLFRCAVAWAPVTDLKKMLVQDNLYDKDYSWYWRVTGGLKGKKLNAFSPLQQFKKISVPTLVLHGTEDDVVFVDQSRLLAKAIGKKRKGPEFRYVELPGIGHNLESSNAREMFLSELERFLAKHNPAQVPTTAIVH